MKKLIIYSSGGLANRLFPLASGIDLANAMGRELYVYWPLDFRCGGDFNDFYEDKINFIEEDFLNSLPKDNTEVFCRFPASVENDFHIYKRSFLFDIQREGKLKIGEPTTLSDAENIVYCTNDFLANRNIDRAVEVLRRFKIKKDILCSADLIAQDLGINKSTLGVHLRGTDMGVSVQKFEGMIAAELSNHTFNKIFICSDDPSFEKYIEGKFNNIVKRDHKIYVGKSNDSQIWTNNTSTPSNSIRDAVIDIILLAKTDFKVYYQDSSFARYAKLLTY